MPTVGDIVKEIERIRILCVGRAGVGKSSLINRILRVQVAAVSHYDVGQADVQSEFTSEENHFLVLHDSKGFEPGDTLSYDIVSTFIKQRRHERLPLKDQLHAVWLCTELPRAGGRILDQQDEKLLQLAHQTRTPVVIIFTKYDQIVRMKKEELREENESLGPEVLDKQSKEEAQKVFDTCAKSLEQAASRMKMPTPHYVNISTYPGYEANISLLVEVTGNLIREKHKDGAWMMWAIAQRASFPVKLDACSFAVMDCFRCVIAGDISDSGRTSLLEVLAGVHQDIVTCWNFLDKENTLRSEAFKKSILLLVQDVEESRNQEQSNAAPSQGIVQILQALSLITDADPSSVPAIGSSGVLEKSLSDPIAGNIAQAQRLLMTYTVCLIAVLRSLFIMRSEHWSSGRTMWLGLKEAFGEYRRSVQQTHHDIHAAFQQDQPILDSDGFQIRFLGLVGSKSRHVSGSGTKDRNTQDAGVSASLTFAPPSPPSKRRSYSTPFSFLKRLSPSSSRSSAPHPEAS